MQSAYTIERDSLNLGKLPAGILDSWPIIPPVQITPERLAPFNGNPDGSAWAHYFIDDYLFVRVWNQPSRYLGVLRRFAGTLSPDFSLYVDDPEPVQRWNDYRNKWLATYWHHDGLQVIPTVSWSDDASFAWCFDGWPAGSVVAVSTQGTQKSIEGKVRFIAGYREMLSRLEPSAVLVYGTPVDIPGPVVWHEPFYSTIKKRR
jgi:hypothetical protein